MEKNLVCVRCPRGCALTVTTDESGQILSVEGNFCKLGMEHARAELTDPRRTVTTTVRLRGGKTAVVPVWTEKPVPKTKIFEILALLRNLELAAPLPEGFVVLENAAGTGINVLTSDRCE